MTYGDYSQSIVVKDRFVIFVPEILDLYLNLLAVNGARIYVGLATESQAFHVRILFGKQATITASNVGGIPMTQEMINFAAENNVLPKIEMITADQVPEAYERVLNSVN